MHNRVKMVDENNIWMTVKVDAMWTVGGDMGLDVVRAPVKGDDVRDVELGAEMEVNPVVARREEEMEGHHMALGVQAVVGHHMAPYEIFLKKFSTSKARFLSK